MKSVRPRFQKVLESHDSLFAFWPIFKNLFAIAALVLIYFYSMHILVVQWRHTIYWIVDILICYNILAGSARSFLMPVLTLVAGFVLVFSHLGGSYWFPHWLVLQVIVLGSVGLILTSVLRWL